MHLSKLINTKMGKMVASVLLGFGLASLFRTLCKNKSCVTFVSPPLDEIDHQIYQHGDKCYTYSSAPVKCNGKKSVEMMTPETAPYKPRV
jgi:hypothetical protein